MPPRMRIVLAVGDLSIGGAERNVVNYAQALKQRGHDVVVAAGDGPLGSELREVDVKRFGPSYRLQRPDSVLRGSLALARFVTKQPVDVVHAFLASSSVVAGLGRLLARARSGSGFALIAAVPGLVQNPGEIQLMTNLRLRLLAANADLVLAPSEFLRTRLVRVGVPATRIRILEFNAIPVDRFTVVDAPSLQLELGLPKHAPIVCSLARLHPSKGQDALLRAARFVLLDVPDARFVFIGDGPWRPYLQRLADELGVSESVRFAGARREIPTVLASAAVVVQATSTMGGPGLSVLEAFAAGVPVVGFEFPELREAVGESGAAILVPHGDVEKLAAGIVVALTESALRAEMVERGRELVHERFDLGKLVARLEAVYEEAQTIRRRRRPS